MIKPATILAAAAALALPAAAVAAPQVNLAATGPVVELSIFESVESVPDRVIIGAGVTSTAATATAAMRQNAAEMQKVIARIKALGIAEKDIQTTGITLGAQYNYSGPTPRFTGYQAANRVSVILRKIDDTGTVLDALVEAGATDISGPDFGVENDAAAKQQARARAVERGEAQARAYATMLGYQGVKVLAVAESIVGGGPIPMADSVVERAAATAAPVQPGVIATGVNVTITYELLGQPAAGIG